MADAPKEAPAAGGKGGLATWLPLIVMVVGMPAMAFVMTNFVLLPKLKAELGVGHAPAGEESAEGKEGGEAKADAPGAKPAKEEGGHGKVKESGHGKEPAKASEHGAGKESGHGGAKSGGARPTFQLSKVLVNVAGSAGSRYLIANYTLVGSSGDFKGKLEERKDQLLDVAIGVMGAKTITDLEKPGARNLIRNELMAAWNNALGGSVVKEIYITEFAIQ
jgi:flagellar FliL protein